MTSQTFDEKARIRENSKRVNSTTVSSLNDRKFAVYRHPQMKFIILADFFYTSAVYCILLSNGVLLPRLWIPQDYFFALKPDAAR